MMRVVSWNMHKQRGSGDFLLSELKPDIALLQESPRIKSTDTKKKTIEVTIKKNLRNTLYSPHKMKKIKLPSDSGMGFNVASVEIDGFGTIYAISVYGNLAFGRRGPNVLLTHTFGLLTVYTKTLRTEYNAKHIIIAGDFNQDPRMDDHKNFGAGRSKKWSILFESICDLGFNDCIKPTYPNQVQTYRHFVSKFPWQIDHMFATDRLFARLKKLEVIDNKKIRERSDHNPIVADFDIGE